MLDCPGSVRGFFGPLSCPLIPAGHLFMFLCKGTSLCSLGIVVVRNCFMVRWRLCACDHFLQCALRDLSFGFGPQRTPSDHCTADQDDQDETHKGIVRILVCVHVLSPLAERIDSFWLKRD